MPKLKLTYFDFPGGRAEPARLALHLGGIPFEDFRFAPSSFPEVRKTTPLNQVPTLHVDDGVDVLRVALTAVVEDVLPDGVELDAELLDVLGGQVVDGGDGLLLKSGHDDPLE